MDGKGYRAGPRTKHTHRYGMADVVTVKEGETLLFGGRRQKLRLLLRSRKVHHAEEAARSLFVLASKQHQKKDRLDGRE